jgi:integrase
LCGVLFLYREVLRQEVGVVELLPRARMPSKVPVVLSPSEVRRVLNELAGIPRIVATLLYGAGLRLQECLELRVKDLDFERGRSPCGGGRDRRTGG